MGFKVGETVVYPHHGAATIEEIVIRKVKGEERKYLVLHVLQGDLIIQVPQDSVEDVGVRDVVDEKGLEEVLDVLREVDVEEPSNWSRRFKANQEKISNGDIVRVSEVVRDLSRRAAGRGLSAGEKRMLTKARGILTSELALARDTDEEDAGVFLDGVLQEGIDAVAAEEEKSGTAKGKKTPTKKAPAKKAAAKKAPAKKAPAKKAPAKKAE